MFEVVINNKEHLVADRMQALKFVDDYARDNNLSLRFPDFDTAWSYTRFILGRADGLDIQGHIKHVSGNEYFD